MTIKSKAVLALVISALCYVILSALVRELDKGFGTMTQVYMRNLVGIILALLLFRKKIRFSRIFNMRKKDLFIISVLMGVIGWAFSIWFITMGALNTKLVNVSVIFSLLPVFAYIFSVAFLRRKPKLNLLLYSLVSIYGSLVIATGSFIPNLQGFGLGELYVLLATATGAMYFIGRKMLSSDLNNNEIALVAMFFSFLSLAILAPLKGESFPGFVPGNVLLALLVSGLIIMIVSVIENFGFEHLDATVGSQILLTEVVYALMIGFIFFQEFPSGTEMVGGMILISGVVLSYKGGVGSD